jgi:hypothetical protein
MRDCWYHDWTKWVEGKKDVILPAPYPELPPGSTYVMRIQRRECTKCGKIQEREI